MRLKKLISSIALSLNLFAIPAKTSATDHPHPRLISLAPHLTEMVFDLALQQQLVAVDEYSNYPEAAKQLPKIGSGMDPNPELLLRYGADILLSYSAAPSIEKIAQNQGMTLMLSHPLSVQDLFDDWRRLLALAQKDPQKAAQIEDKILHIETAWQKTVANYADSRSKSVFILISEKPIYSLSDQSFLSQALKSCKAENIFAEIKQSSFLVNPEDLLLKQPEFIIHGYRADEENGKERSQREVLARFKKLGLTLQSEQLISVNVDILHRPTLRFINTLPSICAALHKDNEPMH